MLRFLNLYYLIKIALEFKFDLTDMKKQEGINGEKIYMVIIDSFYRIKNILFCGYRILGLHLLNGKG